MTANEALKGINQLGLDSAPIIYYVEYNPEYYSRCEPFFQAIASGATSAFTSTLTLPEVLVEPLRTQNAVFGTSFRKLLLNTVGITMMPPDVTISEEASRLRATYNLRTVDAVQIATALYFGCDAFLTNDIKLKRVAELSILVVSELNR